MGKTIFHCYTRDNGEDLFRGNSFESALLEELEEMKTYFSDKKYVKILSEKLNELKGLQHPQKTLNSIFKNDLSLDFEFARQLKLYDVISANCFVSETEIGKALIEHIRYSDLYFILHDRFWSRTDIIEVEFDVAHADYLREARLRLIKGTDEE